MQTGTWRAVVIVLIAGVSFSARADDTVLAKAETYWRTIDEAATKVVWKRSGTPQCLQLKVAFYSIVIPQLDEDRGWMIRATDPQIIAEYLQRYDANEQANLQQIEHLKNAASTAGCLAE